MNMEPISNGKLVELAYKIFIVDKDGDSLIYEFEEDRPDRFIFGQEPGMLESFTNHLEGLKEGEGFDFILAPAEAFGEVDPNLITVLDKSLFEIDGEFDAERVFEGAFVPMMTADGARVEGIVKGITDTNVTIDFNHQLAGETVKYTGKVVTVREATEEELEAHKHHCGGCQGCGDGEGHGDGECCGKGKGHGHGDGECCGKGHGHGHGDGECCGKGHGHGHGDGECCGKGHGHGHGDGECCGKGHGHGHGDGECCGNKE